MEKRLAERGFDPRTSGCPATRPNELYRIWAQHASTAPLCFPRCGVGQKQCKVLQSADAIIVLLGEVRMLRVAPSAECNLTKCSVNLLRRIISSSSSLGSRSVPWLGKGLSMPSPNDLVLCGCPLPDRVAPVFLQVVSSWASSLGGSHSIQVGEREGGREGGRKVGEKTVLHSY